MMTRCQTLKKVNHGNVTDSASAVDGAPYTIHYPGRLPARWVVCGVERDVHANGENGSLHGGARES